MRTVLAPCVFATGILSLLVAFVLVLELSSRANVGQGGSSSASLEEVRAEQSASAGAEYAVYGLTGWFTFNEGWVRVVVRSICFSFYLFLCLRSDGLVTRQKSNAYHPSRGASFGPRISSKDGLRGFLVPIQDFEDSHSNQSPTTTGLLNRCRPWCLFYPSSCISTRRRPPAPRLGCPKEKEGGIFARSDGGGGDGAEDRPTKRNFIALTQRGGCSFVAKVRHAQSLGGIGVIVGDDPTHGGQGPLGRGWGGLWGGRSGLVGMWGGGMNERDRSPFLFHHVYAADTES
jgi:PA domain